jgi:hypothetical protein
MLVQYEWMHFPTALSDGGDLTFLILGTRLSGQREETAQRGGGETVSYCTYCETTKRSKKSAFFFYSLFDFAR